MDVHTVEGVTQLSLETFRMGILGSSPSVLTRDALDVRTLWSYRILQQVISDFPNAWRVTRGLAAMRSNYNNPVLAMSVTPAVRDVCWPQKEAFWYCRIASIALNVKFPDKTRTEWRELVSFLHPGILFGSLAWKLQPPRTAYANLLRSLSNDFAGRDWYFLREHDNQS